MQEYWVMKITGKKTQTGFSLVEVMIAMLIMVTGMLSVATMQISSVHGNSSASGQTEAVAIAQSKIEELVLLGFDSMELADIDLDGTRQDGDNNGVDDDNEGNSVDSILNFGLDDTGVDSDGVQQIRGATNILYHLYWNIGVDVPAVNSLHIRLHVQWQQNAQTRTVTLDRIKANI
jgi:prepilin-type N-terminal cleavage/methylation domain-containing protein